MNTTVKNIAKNTSNSFATDSKWNDAVVFSATVPKQLRGDMEV